jgi:hypothetical protein
MAAAVVAAHNHVLRRWLRGESPDPLREVGEAMEQVIGQLDRQAGPDRKEYTLYLRPVLLVNERMAVPDAGSRRAIA